jgi:primosomal protein N' (replication factor Y)
VGIINADNAINSPDFLANRRVFQRIIPVSGYPGRSRKLGIVVIQTHFPSSILIILAVENDVESFVKKERITHSEFSDPSCSRIIRLIISGQQ